MRALWLFNVAVLGSLGLRSHTGGQAVRQHRDNGASTENLKVALVSVASASTVANVVRTTARLVPSHPHVTCPGISYKTNPTRALSSA